MVARWDRSISRAHWTLGEREWPPIVQDNILSHWVGSRTWSVVFTVECTLYWKNSRVGSYGACWSPSCWRQALRPFRQVFELPRTGCDSKCGKSCVFLGTVGNAHDNGLKQVSPKNLRRRCLRICSSSLEQAAWVDQGKGH